MTETGEAAGPVSRRRLALVGAALTLSWLAFAWPAWRSATARDPLSDFFTDHLRYRYCAALTVASPLRALTTPLATLYAEDRRAHRELLWEAEPCHQPGVVFLAVHAPLQWLLDAELISEVRATGLYVLLLLAAMHLAVGRLLVTRLWWAGLAVYPFLLRCALNGLQEPIPFALALFGAFDWAAGRRLRGLALATLAFSAYSRWVVWPGGLALLCWRDRRALLPELRERARSWHGALGLVALAGVLGWSLLGNWLVATAWVAPQGALPLGRSALLVGYAALLALCWWRAGRSDLAPVVLVALGFLLVYRGQVFYWYLAPVLPAIALSRRPSESWLWALAPLALPGLLFHLGLWPRGAWAVVQRGWLE